MPRRIVLHMHRAYRVNSFSSMNLFYHKSPVYESEADDDDCVSLCCFQSLPRIERSGDILWSGHRDGQNSESGRLCGSEVQRASHVPTSCTCQTVHFHGKSQLTCDSRFAKQHQQFISTKPSPTCVRCGILKCPVTPLVPPSHLCSLIDSSAVRYCRLAAEHDLI